MTDRIVTVDDNFDIPQEAYDALQARQEAHIATKVHDEVTTEGTATQVALSSTINEGVAAGIAPVEEAIQALPATYVPATVVTGQGVDPTGAADSTAALQARIDAAPSGGAVEFPRGTYRITAPLVIAKPVRLTGPGVVKQTTGSAAAFSVESSDVEFRDLTIEGPGATLSQAGSAAITATGDAATPYRNIHVQDVEIRGFRQYGIRLKHVTDYSITDNYIHDCWYALVMTLGCQRGRIVGNQIDTATAGMSDYPQSYGIALTFDGTDATPVRSADIVVANNIVRNIVGWEGIDTHAGQRITITGNEVTGCKVGIAVVDGGTTWAPLDVSVVGNVIDSLNDAGKAHSGITFTGVGVTGAPAQNARGTIVGNTIRRHGNEDGTMGAIYVVFTEGVVISGNSISLAGTYGINLFHDNYGYVCTGNTISEVWSNTQSFTAAIGLRSGYNTGTITGNVYRATGEKATATLRNDRGVYTSDETATITTMGVNDFTPCALPYVGGLAQMRAGFYNAAPVAKAAAIASPAADAAALKTAVDAIRTALKNIGITA